MKKYLTVFSASWQNEFVYRLNFVLWRFRNILRLLMTYFLWRGVFASNMNVYGYSQPQIVSYVFMVLIVSSVVLSSPSSDNIGGEISNGDLSNYLLKPLGYLKYWFTRDIASKCLNILFACGEVFLLWLIFKPIINWSFNPLGFISLGLAVVMYYFISTSSRFVAFWMPENTWGLAFLVLTIVETLSGGIFPLNILPSQIRNILELTPFPYLLYFPISIFQGKIIGIQLTKAIFIALVWVIFLFIFTKWLWGKGIKNYGAEGR